MLGCRSGTDGMHALSSVTSAHHAHAPCPCIPMHPHATLRGTLIVFSRAPLNLPFTLCLACMDLTLIPYQFAHALLLLPSGCSASVLHVGKPCLAVFLSLCLCDAAPCILPSPFLLLYPAFTFNGNPCTIIRHIGSPPPFAPYPCTSMQPREGFSLGSLGHP